MSVIYDILTGRELILMQYATLIRQHSLTRISNYSHFCLSKSDISMSPVFRYITHIPSANEMNRVLGHICAHIG